MRIIHDIDRPAKVILSGKVYTKRVVEPKSHGWNADVTLYVGPDEHGRDPEEVNLQGNAKHIISVLKEAVAMMESVADDFVKGGTLRPDWETFDGKTPKKRAPSKSTKKRG